MDIIHLLSFSILISYSGAIDANYVRRGSSKRKCIEYCGRSKCNYGYLSSLSPEHQCTCTDCGGPLPRATLSRGGLKSCTVYGDPHYKTFDGRAFSSRAGGRKRRTEMANGGDSFILVKENAFSITANTANCGQPSCLLLSITVNYGPKIIQLGQSGVVSLDGVDKQLPLDVNGMFITILSDSYVLVELPGGISAIWDGQHKVVVSAPPRHGTKGLCGNNDDNPNNDMQTPDGTICDSVQEFIASWETKNVL